MVYSHVSRGLLAALIVCWSVCPAPCFARAHPARTAGGVPALRSNAVYVLDETNANVVLSRQSDVAMPIASITKLMTAMVVLDAGLDLNQIITISAEDMDVLRGTREPALFFASLGVLTHIARQAARYASRLFVPQNDVQVMTITQAAVRDCYQSEGRLDAYHEEDVRFMSDEQFAAMLEIHLAGHTVTRRDGQRILIDTHGRAVDAAV